ncbi:hypothetical protein J5N97_026235 [Dioscorea zingiberensis]|uniref:Carbohydrate kinase PfkB domain-containing protein n=1 Tax=Dioscorea zingiberensis TaxID=325984 RepID=A0A9D5C358_9LILI|nr:hypothetical protein J5N97_026235 [Dioscorea zingiberensis]
MHPDRYSNWKQWGQPEFVSAPGGPPSTVAISHFNPQLSLPEFVSASGGPPSNVAISYVSPGGQAVFMEKVGDDDFGNDLVLKMNMERVQTCTVEIEKRKMLEKKINEMQSSDLELWEVDEYIYNANEFELEKENQHQPLVEDEAQEQNEGQGEESEDNDENVTEAIVHEEEISLKPHVDLNKKKGEVSSFPSTELPTPGRHRYRIGQADRAPHATPKFHRYGDPCAVLAEGFHAAPSASARDYSAAQMNRRMIFRMEPLGRRLLPSTADLPLIGRIRRRQRLKAPATESTPPELRSPPCSSTTLRQLHLHPSPTKFSPQIRPS